MLTFTSRTAVSKSLGRWLSSSLANACATPIDPLQANSLKEKCFLVDPDDKVIGSASKEDCHRVSPSGCIPLHRAFSVFCFNKKGDMLMQKRSSVKITYPDYFTNACCSHPLADIPGEDEEANAIGIKRAAQRRINYELGINVKDIPIDKFHYLTRIHYFDAGNGQWGEHEIDYILFLQGDFELDPNPNEVSQISFIPKDTFNAFIPTLGGPFTPWFSLILHHRLFLWWNNLDNLEKFTDHKIIHNFKNECCENM